MLTTAATYVALFALHWVHVHDWLLLMAYFAWRGSRPPKGRGAQRGSEHTAMPDPLTPTPEGEPQLLTLPEAAIVTGLSVKALTRRIERGTLPSERHHARRVVRRGELERQNLIGAGNRTEDGGGEPAGEIVIWRELYEREHQEGEQLRQERDELRLELAALANASGIRAWKLKRETRAKLSS